MENVSDSLLGSGAWWVKVKDTSKRHTQREREKFLVISDSVNTSDGNLENLLYFEINYGHVSSMIHKNKKSLAGCS